MDPQTAYDETLKRVLAVTNRAAPPVYLPSDDSVLMIDAIARLPLNGMRILDVGTGSGILGLYSAMHGAEVTASDIDKAAIDQADRAARELGVEMKLQLSDLFSNTVERFDLILFNPPYLPSIGVQDRSVDGGSGGTVLVDRFLEALPNHLVSGAEALLLLSSLNEPASVELRHKNLEFSLAATKRLFFEELQVLRVRLRDDLTI